ncbi:ion transporter [Egicoccus sp. AB-alg2]|uniref:ion transporter n=1 Tax=Egicoccus sp. AB-alg2 TaxID=3242693 RepID=UPI00359DD9D4
MSATADTLAPDPDEEPTPRERLAAVLEQRLDVPMAVLAVVWAALVAYELVAPGAVRPALATTGNVIWGVFVAEFLLKLVVSGHPLRFLRRHWPSLLFLVLPVLRVLRIARALRVVRVLPAARVVGSSYRAVGTARGLLTGRLQFLAVMTGIVTFGGGQLLYVIERDREGALTSLGDALYWAANLAIASNVIYTPVTLAGRLLSLVLSTYALVVFASLAGSLGAFFVESRQERAAVEDEKGET